MQREMGGRKKKPDRSPSKGDERLLVERSRGSRSPVAHPAGEGTKRKAADLHALGIDLSSMDLSLSDLELDHVVEQILESARSSDDSSNVLLKEKDVSELSLGECKELEIARCPMAKPILSASRGWFDLTQRVRLVDALFDNEINGNVRPKGEDYSQTRHYALPIEKAIGQLAEQIDRIPRHRLKLYKLKIKERIRKYELTWQESVHRLERWPTTIRVKILGHVYKDRMHGLGYGRGQPSPILDHEEVKPEFQTTEKRTSFEVKLVKRWTFGRILRYALGISALLWATAYVAGYPPPQRLLLPSQRTGLEQRMDRCHEMYRTGYRDHFGDFLLSDSLARKKAELLCAESRFREGL